MLPNLPSHSLPEDVAALVLFGSRARGDADSNSDTDLAVFSHSDTADALVQLKAVCSEHPDLKPCSLSVYSVLTAERMAEAGSLFLWHLRLEGEVLFRHDSWIEELLSGLKPYDRECAHRDLATFQLATSDTRKALASGDETISFEAASLFATLRGVGMIVAMRQGQAEFGRLSSIDSLRDSLGAHFPLSDCEVLALAAARLGYARGIPTRASSDPMSGPTLRGLADRILTILEAACDRLD